MDFSFIKADYGTLATMKTLALVFLTLVYVYKLYALTRFRLIKEISVPKGDPGKGAMSSLTVNARPWAMESSRNIVDNWLEFVIFHVGIATAIIVSFVIPYGPELLASTTVTGVLMAIMGLGFLAGVVRMTKKFSKAEKRIISSKDDFFSMIIINIFLLLGAVSMTANETIVVAFIAFTTFLLIYVPLSKISHYLYWPFARYFMGKHFGRRGVYL